MKKYQNVTKAELIKCIKALEKRSPSSHFAFERERVLHDLQVHQIELETQNRELRETQHLLELSRDRYADLYDYAPVGYLTLDHEGVIREANLSAAGMFGIERARLLGTPFHFYVFREDLPYFREHLRTASSPGEPASTEFRIICKNHGTTPVMVQSVVVYDTEKKAHSHRLALTDITARKQSETAVRESGALSRGILDSLAAHVAVLDATGNIIAVNDPWSRFARENGDFAFARLGYGMNYLKICREAVKQGDEDAAHALRGIEEVLTGIRPCFDLEYPCHSPSAERWFHMSVTPLSQGSSTTGVVISHLDITQRRIAEQLVRENESRLRTILGSAVEGIITIDDQGLVESFNPAAERIFGYTAAEAIGQNIKMFMPAPYRQAHDEYLAHYRKTGERKIIGSGREVAGQRKDGSAFPIDLSVSEVLLEGRRLFTGFVRDITERKRVEEALRRSEENLAHAQSIAHVGSYEINNTEDRSSHWSGEIFRILGLDPAGKDLTTEQYLRLIVHPEDRERIRESVEHAVSEGRRYEAEYRIVRPDGSIRIVHSIADPVYDAGKQVIKFIGSLQDITERKELEKEVLEISEREQSRIGQDLHDGLCQHLAGIEFRLLGLKQKLEGKLNEQAAEVNRLSTLVRDAIDQTRTLARGLSPVMLELDGLMNALAELTLSVKETFGITCSFNCPAPVLIHDNAVATHLYRIAQEAVHNAIRHGKPEVIVIKLLAINDRIILGVQDNGVGITTPPHGHKGMGLRVMQYRAGTIGGSLAVQRDAGGGTSVICSLRAPSAQKSGLAARDPKQVSSGGSKHLSPRQIARNP